MNLILERIKSKLQPEGRALATAATCELHFNNAPSLTEGVLNKAMLILAKAKAENEAGNVAGRRATCAEIADLTAGDGDIANAIAAWNEWVSYLTAQMGVVPEEQKGRFSAMLATAERELAELKDFVG